MGGKTMEKYQVIDVPFYGKQGSIFYKEKYIEIETRLVKFPSPGCMISLQMQKFTYQIKRIE